MGLNLSNRHSHPALLNGAAVTGLTSSNGFRIHVPAGTKKLTVSTQGPTGTSSDEGQAFLYVRNLWPVSSSSCSCASTRASISNACTITDPVAGTWFIQTTSTHGVYDLKATFE
ncbi:pre-peptidase C-terminal domain-containing protein [Myxococcus sp. 1LA]